MIISNIDRYRQVVEKYNGNGLFKADDLLLDWQAESFYKSKASTELTGIIEYLRHEAISTNLDGLAGELEVMLNAGSGAIPATRQNPDKAASQITPTSHVDVHCKSKDVIEGNEYLDTPPEDDGVENCEVYTPDFLIL